MEYWRRRVVFVWICILVSVADTSTIVKNLYDHLIDSSSLYKGITRFFADAKVKAQILCDYTTLENLQS